MIGKGEKLLEVKKGISCIRLFCHYVHKSLRYPGTCTVARMNKEGILSYLCWEFLKGKERNEKHEVLN